MSKYKATQPKLKSITLTPIQLLTITATRVDTQDHDGNDIAGLDTSTHKQKNSCVISCLHCLLI